MLRGPQLKKRQEYAGVKEVTGNLAGKEEWPDTETISLPAFSLTILNDDDMINEVKIFLTGMFISQTPRSIASALLLTWNMRTVDPVETRLFPAKDSGAGVDDVSIHSLEEEETNYIDPTIADAVDSVGSKFNVRRAGAFVAASTLKMFAKSPTGWALAWSNDHIKKRYKDFNKVDFPFSFELDLGCVEHMYEAYQGQRLYQGTLGRILYALGEVEDPRQTSMLFEQHLSCTGMHLIPQFINAKMSIGATTEDLLNAIDFGQNRETLKQLVLLINNSISKPIGPENRGTWRFARIFNAGAFTTLQTKHCRDTVAILAYINTKAQSSTKLSNPLNIAVLKQMGRESLKHAKAVAGNIHHYFTVTSRARENEFFDIDRFNHEGKDNENEEEEEEN